MECPICKEESQSYCKKCGIDITLFSKINNISFELYNNALELAKNKEYSNAIYFLETCIIFNKNDERFRNALGLCYCAIGRATEALYHWFISVQIQPKNNLATEYLDYFDNNKFEIEKISDSITMFNNALEQVKQKSDDLAVIQLKKAFETNQPFVEAGNLLALCYILQKSYRKAQSVIEKVLTIDLNNPVSLRYLNECYSQNLSQVKTTSYDKKNIDDVKKAKPEKNERLVPFVVQNQKPTMVPIIIAAVAGFVVSFAVIYILIMPSAISAKDKYITELETTNKTKIEQQETKINEYSKTIDTLNSTNEELKATNAELEKQNKITAAYTSFAEVENLVSKKQYEQAYDLLATVEIGADFPVDLQEKKKTLSATINEELEKTYYNRGLADYNNKKYDEAKDNFEKSKTFSTPTSTVIDDTYYYLGRIAELKGENDVAKTLYEQILRDYPDSNQTARVKTRLSALR